MRAAVVSLCALQLLACTALTKSQVQAVNQFAEATAGFEELPPQVLRSYDEVRFGAGVLSVATVNAGLPGVDAYQSLETKVDQSLELTADAAELRATLEILKTYTALLQTLSSDEFTSALEEKAKQLGQSLDHATAQYNAHFAHQLDSFAGIAAAAVDAAGSVALRVRQGNYLREFVARANRGVPAVLQRVRAIAAIDVAGERVRLRGIYDFIARSQGALQYDEATELADLLRKLKAAEKLSAAVQGACDGYVAAHDGLAKALQDKHDLPGRLEPVIDLGMQVKRAAAIKNDYR